MHGRRWQFLGVALAESLRRGSTLEIAFGQIDQVLLGNQTLWDGKLVWLTQGIYISVSLFRANMHRSLLYQFAVLWWLGCQVGKVSDCSQTIYYKSIFIFGEEFSVRMFLQTRKSKSKRQRMGLWRRRMCFTLCKVAQIVHSITTFDRRIDPTFTVSVSDKHNLPVLLIAKQSQNKSFLRVAIARSIV